MAESLGTAVLTLATDLASFATGLDQAEKKLVGLNTTTDKQKVSFKQMADGAVAVGAAVTAVAGGVALLGERGANINDVRGHFKNLTSQMGDTEAVMNSLRKATLGNATDMELMSTVNLSLSQGLKLTADQLSATGDISAVLADRIGGDVTDAFDTLMQAMATGQDRQLKNIGLNIDAAAATEAHANAIGKKVSELTEEEKKEAIKNAILIEGQRILKESGKATEDFGDKVASSKNKVTNFVDSISSWIATSPQIGTWASVITATSGTITVLGAAVGPVSTGISKLIPLLGLGGGLTGAFSGMAAFVTSTIMPLISTALPFALKALAALFSVPAGLIIAGILAVVAIWKNWDTIGPIVMNVYTAVKTWLVDKFNAIVESIRQKIEAVTGFFKNMYDKVVGHSYVPDMVNGIASQFGRLNSVMVNPTEKASSNILSAFDTLSAGVLGKVSGMLNGASGMLNEWAAKARDWVDNQIGKLSSRWQGAISGAASGIGSLASGGSTSDAMGAVGQAAVGAGLSAAMGGASIGASVAVGATTMGVGLAAIGVYKGITALLGQNEHKKVNDIRDQWFAANGGLEGVNQAAQGAGDSNLSLTKAIFAAKKRPDFERAVSNWERATGITALASGGIAMRPTMSLIGERGPEAVIPLNGRAGNSIINVLLDGRQAARAIVPYFRQEVDLLVGA